MVNGADIAATMRRAAQHLEAASSFANAANELELPKLFFRGRAIAEINETFGRAVGEGRLALQGLDGITGPAQDAMRGVQELLDLIDPSLHRSKHKGLDYLRAYSETRDVAGRLGVRADTLRLLADHAGEAPEATRSALDAELGALASRPFASIGRDDVRRLAAIEALPEPLRPAFPPRVRDNYGPTELVVRRMLPGSDNIARGEFEALRLHRVRAEMAADPSITRESLDAEVRAIIAVPDAEFTTELSTRLSAIAGLGDELRPALVDTPVPWPQHRLQDMSAWGWLPQRDGDSRAKLAALRMAVEQEALIADPAITRESVTRELVELLAIPNEQLTDAQLHRTSLLARLPAALRPPMPERIDWHYAFEDLGLLRYHPRGNRAAAKSFDLMRIHLAAVVDPELTITQLAARVQRGERIDFRVLAALEGQEELLAAHGLTRDVLNREAVKSLATAGEGSPDALRHHLERVRSSIAAIPAGDEKLATIRTQALELADRNLDRMSGKRSDTYARHPDYAEVGRIVSIAELLESVTSRKPVAPAPVATPGAAGEVLTW